VKTNKRLYCS